MPLHALRDAMQDRPEHPLAAKFNWPRLPEKVELDQALASHHNDHRRARLADESLPVLRYGHFFLGVPGTAAGPVVGRILETLKSQFPWLTAADVDQSARRHHSRANRGFVSAVGPAGTDESHVDAAGRYFDTDPRDPERY
jgi:hypothetical protein